MRAMPLVRAIAAKVWRSLNSTAGVRFAYLVPGFTTIHFS
jgi:hypothetical protein